MEKGGGSREVTKINFMHTIVYDFFIKQKSF